MAVILRAHATAGGRALVRDARRMHSGTDGSVFVLYRVHVVVVASPFSFVGGAVVTRAVRRRLENASWRIWGMRRSKGHSRLQLLPDGTVDEVQNDPGSSDGSLQRRATTGSSSPDPHRRASRGASGSGSSSSALPTGGGVAPPTGGLLSPDNLTPDGIVLGGGKANGDAGWAHRPSAAGAGGDGDDDDQSELVVPHPVSQSWVDAQASEEAERAAVLRQRRAQRKQQSLDRLVALSEATDGPADGERGDGGGAPEWLRPSAHEPRAADGSGAGGGGEPPVKRPGTPPCGEINWDVLDASPVGKNTKLLEVMREGRVRARGRGG